MRRRLLAGLLGGALLLGGVAGCGIPENTEVRVDGPGPAAEGGSTSGSRGEPPGRSAGGTDAEQFVENFLSAAAGEPDRAYQRVQQFIAPADRDRLQDKQGSEVALTVVRLREEPVTVDTPDRTKVTLKVQQVGLLRADGTLAPPATEHTSTCSSCAASPGRRAGRTGPVRREPAERAAAQRRRAETVLPEPDDLLLEHRPHPAGPRPALPAPRRAGRAAGHRGGEVAGGRPVGLAGPGVAGCRTAPT